MSLISLGHLAVTAPLSYLVAFWLPALDAVLPVLPSETAVITLGVATAGSADPRIVHWICQRAGGFFIKNPRTHHPHPEFLIPATNEIIQEFADLLAVIAKAVADDQITGEEAVDIRGRWEELKSVTEGFVQCCEQGNFRHIKKHVDTRAAAKAQAAAARPHAP